MDCNGCVHKLKKALHGINGIYDIHIDFPQQKLIIIGWADTEKIVKAIRKTRKIIGSVCVHTDESSEAPPQGSDPPPPEGEQPPPPNGECPPNAENNPQPEPPNDPPPPENPALEIRPSFIAAEANEDLPLYHSMPRDVEEIHVIHHRQRDYNGRPGNYVPENHPGYWSNYPPRGHGFRPQPPVYSSHGSRHEPPVYLHASRPEPPIYSHGPMPEPPVYSHRPRPEPPIYSHGPMPEPPVYSHQSRPEPPIYSHVSRPEPPIYVHSSRHEPQPPVYTPTPVYVAHSYNNYTPTPSVSVSEYEYAPPPLRRQPRPNRMEHYYNEDYYIRDNGYQNSDNRNGNNITSIFSDENPNACRIV